MRSPPSEFPARLSALAMVRLMEITNGYGGDASDLRVLANNEQDNLATEMASVITRPRLR